MERRDIYDLDMVMVNKVVVVEVPEYTLEDVEGGEADDDDHGLDNVDNVDDDVQHLDSLCLTRYKWIY